MDARRALLEHLIDHAALFPPASLPMPEALAEDHRAGDSADSWLLARFVCPVSKLPELAGETTRSLSVVADAPVPYDPRIESVEARHSVEFDGEVYVELPLDDTLDERLDDVASLGLRAKVRCGGASVPEAADLARFIQGCRERDVVFKATAGLHHAYPTAAGEHGFLNVLAAAVFGDEEDALAAGEGSFELDARSFRWDTREADAIALRLVRGTLFHSIGSCSFFEPVEELRARGMLPT
jgi:hypothetical protein